MNLTVCCPSQEHLSLGLTLLELGLDGLLVDVQADLVLGLEGVVDGLLLGGETLGLAALEVGLAAEGADGRVVDVGESTADAAVAVGVALVVEAVISQRHTNQQVVI